MTPISIVTVCLHGAACWYAIGSSHSCHDPSRCHPACPSSREHRAPMCIDWHRVIFIAPYTPVDNRWRASCANCRTGIPAHIAGTE